MSRSLAGKVLVMRDLWETLMHADCSQEPAFDEIVHLPISIALDIEVGDDRLGRCDGAQDDAAALDALPAVGGEFFGDDRVHRPGKAGSASFPPRPTFTAVQRHSRAIKWNKEAT